MFIGIKMNQGVVNVIAIVLLVTKTHLNVCKRWTGRRKNAGRGQWSEVSRAFVNTLKRCTIHQYDFATRSPFKRFDLKSRLEMQ